MKKIILTSCFALLFGAFSNAQDNTTDLRENFTFGLKGGLNLSNVYDEEGEDFEAESKVGFAAGAFIAIPFGKYIGFQPEFLFSQRGFQSSGSLLGSTYNMSRTLNFIDVPLLFSFKPSEFINLVAGPQYSYLISRKDVFQNGSSTIEQEKEFENDNLRKNILCFTGGIDLTMKHLVIGARAGWDFQDNKGDGTSSTPRYKNVWYQATIGYRFF